MCSRWVATVRGHDEFGTESVDQPIDADRTPRHIGWPTCAPCQSCCSRTVSCPPFRLSSTSARTGYLSARPEADFAVILANTLQTHHQLGCDIAITAAALGIHRSTVRYRLHRIRGLTGLEPTDLESLQTLLDITEL